MEALNRLAPLEHVEQAMATLVGHGDPLATIGQEHLATGGKRSRAKLALAVAEALGADRTDAVLWATAVELLHNATLIHDDLQDGDRVRRGHAATWVAHGPAQAINAGDLLLMLPYRALEDMAAEPAVRWYLSRALARRAEATVRGQALELSLPDMAEYSWADWLSAARGKSGELLALPVEGSALLAGLEPHSARALGDALIDLGALYQMVDDLVDLYGDKGRNELGCDLKEGKVSCVVVEHLARVPEDRLWIRTLLHLDRSETPDDQVQRACAAFRESGAAAAVAQRVHQGAARLLENPHLTQHEPVRALAARFLKAFTAPLHDMEL